MKTYSCGCEIVERISIPPVCTAFWTKADWDKMTYAVEDPHPDIVLCGMVYRFDHELSKTEGKKMYSRID